MTDFIEEAVYTYEYFCDKYYYLKPIKNKSETEMSEYLTVKDSLKKDIPDSIYMNALKRCKSDQTFLKSLKRLNKKSLGLLKQNKNNQFIQYLEFNISLFDNCAFDFLKIETKNYYCFTIARLLKVGDSEGFRLLNKLIQNIKITIDSFTNRICTCAVLVKEIVSAFNSNYVGKSIRSEDELDKIRIKFQDDQLIKILQLVVHKLDTLKNTSIKPNTNLHILREQLLLILLSILRCDFKGNFGEKHAKILTSKFSSPFRPPHSWREIIFSLQIFQILFRILKNGCADMYTELLVLSGINQIGTLQLSYNDNLENIEEFIKGYSLRLSEVIEKFSHNFKSKTILYTIIAIHRFHSTSIFYNRTDVRFLKMFAFLNYKSAFAKIFVNLMEKLMASQFKNKTLIKSLVIFLKFMKDIYLLSNAYLSIDQTENLAIIFDFIEQTYKELFCALLIKPLGNYPAGCGSIQIIQKFLFEDKSQENNVICKYQEVLYDTLINDIFLKVLYDKIINVSERLFSYMNLYDICDKKTKSETSTCSQALNIDEFIDLIGNTNILINICKRIYFSKFLGEFDQSTGFYIKNVTKYKDNTFYFLRDFDLWIKNSNDNDFFNSIFKKKINIDPFSGVYCMIFVIGKILLTFLNHENIRTIIMPTIEIYLKCLCKISKMSDDINIFDFNFLEDAKNNDFQNKTIMIDNFREVFCRVIIEFCYKMMDPLLKLDIKKTNHCLGNMLKIQELRDCVNIIYAKQLKTCDNYQKLELSQKMLLYGILGIVKHFPKELYYRDKYKRLIEFFVNPVINFIPLIWRHTTMYSDFIHQYAIFCIELFNLYSAFPHKLDQWLKYSLSKDEKIRCKDNKLNSSIEAIKKIEIEA
ncbi:hypothetical protein HZS_3695, partial [Henneguya salminicola]